MHQPVALLWAAQRATKGEPRVAPWHDARGHLAEIIAAVGDRADDETVAARVLGLRGSPLLDFHFRTSSPLERGVRADQWLDERNPLLGLSDGAYRTLAGEGALERFAEIAVDGLPKSQGRLIREYFGIFAGFGEVPGVPEGTMFENRAALVERRVHINRQWGIVGNRERGAESVVVSGGYEDDEDYGDVIIYTGHGGRDSSTGKQIADQSIDDTGNAALVTSHVNQVPVRVIRGPRKNDKHAPSSGYRYDGLFQVEKFWQRRGLSKFQVCLYRLVKVAGRSVEAQRRDNVLLLPAGNEQPGRKTSTVDRVTRIRALSQAVKDLHNHVCQTCGIRLAVAGRGYAEGAHIKPVGQPHNGNDTADNLLCLCPNCHVLFDNGEIVIEEDFSIVSDYPNSGFLRRVNGHEVGVENLAYHRNLFPKA